MRYVFSYQNGKSTISYITILIFISWKKTKAAKRISKIIVKNGECYNVGSKNKTVFHFP